MGQVTAGALVRFCFVSELAHEMSPHALLRLARQCWSDNHRAAVTGSMRVCGSRVEQTIEGAAPAILALSARILTDPRHGRIEVRGFEQVAARQFSGWSVEGLAPLAAGPDRGPLRVVVRPAPRPEPGAAEMPPLAAAGAT